MDNLTKDIINFVKERNWNQLDYPETLIKSIFIEAGELLECIQWNNLIDQDQVSEELADVLIYCIELAYALNLNLETIIKAKLDKNKIKYPVK